MMLNILEVQIRRIFSVRLIIIAVISAAFHLMASAFVLRESVWSVIFGGGQSGIGYFVVYMFPTAVFSDSLAREWKDNTARFWIIRSGLRPYIIAKMLAAAMGGFVCIFLAFSLVSFFAHFLAPWFTGRLESCPYSQLMEQGRLLEGFLLALADMGISGAISAVFGMAASSFILNPFTAMAAPLVLILTFSRIAEAAHLPERMNPAQWLCLPNVFPEPTPLVMILRRIGVLIVIMTVLTVITLHQMERRLRNE